MERKADRPTTEPARAERVVAAWVGASSEGLAALLAGDHARELETDWGWNVIALGGERRASVGAWASRTGATEVSSLRELARPGTSVVLVLDREVPGEEDLRLLLEHDRTVILAGAQPLTLVAAARLDERGGRLVIAPALQHSAARRVAAPVLEEFLSEAPPTAVTIRVRCRPGECSADAMLTDACATCLDLVATPESVIALGRSPVDVAEPRSIVALMRTESGGLVTIDVADGGGWLREIELVGAAGRVRFTDALIERFDRHGESVERHSLDGPTNAAAATIETLRAMARLRTPTASAERLRAALALAEAARLSMRTGNAESPARMHELAARP